MNVKQVMKPLMIGLIVSSVHAQETKVTFDKGVSLTPDQVQSVLRLANECGIMDVSELRTYASRVVQGHAIIVKGKEVSRGGKTAQPTIDVQYVGWNGATTNAGAKRHGDFWVLPPYVVTNYFADIVVAGRSHKVDVPDDLAPESAQRILNAFAYGELKKGTDPQGSALRYLEYIQGESRPIAIRSQEAANEYKVIYSEPFNLQACVKLVGTNVILTEGPSMTMYD